MKENFNGIFPYLVSPINEDGTIKEGSLRQIVEHLIDCGVHGLVPLGSTGEFYYLNNEQKRKIVEIVVDQAAGRVPVIAGVASSSTLEATIQAKDYEKIGVDGILLILNVYFPLKQEDVYNYFKDVSESVSCPIVIYNNPKFTGFEIQTDTLNRLSQIQNIRYYKDASANTGRLFEIKNITEGKLDIFSASAHVPVFVMMMGGKGWMAGPACVIRRESIRLYNMCCEKRWDEAMEYQKKIWKMNSVFQKYNLAACIKAALNLQGFDVGYPVAPNALLSDEAINEIKGVLVEIQGDDYKVINK